MTIRPPRESSASLMAEMNLNEHEIAQRKAFLQFLPEDAQRLYDVNELAKAYAAPSSRTSISICSPLMIPVSSSKIPRSWITSSGCRRSTSSG